MTLATSHVWEGDGGCKSQIAVGEESVGVGTEVADVASSFEKFVGGVGVDTCHSIWLPSNCLTSLCLGNSLSMNLAERQSPPSTRYKKGGL